MASESWIDNLTAVQGVSESRSAPDEAVLVQAAQRDRAAFSPLYRRYARPVYGYCYRRLGHRESAEDATSQIFMKALASLHRCRPDAFRSWLFTIAHNVVADVHRKGPVIPLDESWEIEDIGQSPEELVIHADDARTVRRLLSQLTPDQRDVVELRLNGLTGAEIAAVLGRRQGAIRSTQFRAYQRLRDMLEQEGERS